MRLIERVTGAMERSTKLDDVGDYLTTVSTPLSRSGTLRDILSGTPLGHPVHPLMVTLPIGAWVSALVLDATGDRDAARRLVGFGVLAAAPTAAAGLSDWHDTYGAERRVGVVHSLCNTTAVAMYSASWMARRRGRDGAGTLLSLVGAGLLSIGGYLGGHLTYARGVGVDTTVFDAGPREWTPVGADSDIKDESFRRVEVAGVGLLVTRVKGKVVAIEDRCTHRGGPLHEGERDNDRVTCPWHGSTFSLLDGSVQRGPATRPQVSYETRVVDGHVEVRYREPGSLRKDPV